jgi:hypothetical protein
MLQWRAEKLRADRDDTSFVGCGCAASVTEARA